jgi:tRNA nucleotidyltransferase (CCA-adding enzyme)
VLFCLLLDGASRADAQVAVERLALTGRQAEAVRGFVELREHEDALAAELRPSEAVALLRSTPLPAVEAFSFVAGSQAAERVGCYLHEWRFVRSRLNGRDVEALGVPHGPRVGETLALLREARLDGRVRTREDEVTLVRARLLGEARLAEVARG